MKLPTKLVAVKKISSEVARSQFPADDIEKTAHLIIAVEGIINPIILRRTSLESYEVVEGHLEYYAAVRAREINPLKGEMIQAIVIEPNNEEAILGQIDCLRSPFIPSLPSSDSHPNTPDELSTSNRQNDLEFRLINLERIFQSQFEELRKDNRKLESTIGDLQKKLDPPTTQPHFEHSLFVEQVVSKITTVIEQLPRTGSGRSSRKKSIEELIQNPVDLNQASKSELCSVRYVGETTATEIIDRREARPFAHVDELKKLRGFNQIKRNPQWDQCFIVE
ncbi:MAG: helix-hairpin-helix domain-containing protein [Leptolyngbyaceae cyanobacterium]